MIESSELEHLRREQRERKSFYYQIQEKYMFLILALWGVAIGLPVYKEVSSSDNYILLKLGIAMFLVLVSMLIMISAVAKDNENVKRRIRIGTYVLLFHEKKTKKGEKLQTWETAIIEEDINKSENEKKENKRIGTYSNPFILFAYASFFINIVLFAFQIVLFGRFNISCKGYCVWREQWHILCLVFSYVFIIISLWSLLEIHKMADPKQLLEWKKEALLKNILVKAR
ncbi:MAG: hypothetical protein FWF95_02550 [Syntrophorhabdaceae bacterium]|nr:hypothetical protein [Syntrophorhabdaceae bacterium]